MNAKKMTLTLSTLLILVQPSQAADQYLTAGAALTGALALGTIFKGPEKTEIKRLGGEINGLKGQIAALERDINGQISADGEVTVQGLRHTVKDLKEMTDGQDGFPALRTIRADYYGYEAHQGNPAIPGFKEITNQKLAAIDQEMITIKGQIEALEAARGGQGAVDKDDAPLQALREQLARELPAFRTDLDELKAGLDREAAARALLAERVGELEKSGALYEQRFIKHAEVSDSFAARLDLLEGAASKSTTSTAPKVRKRWSLRGSQKTNPTDDAQPTDGGADAEDDN